MIKNATSITCPATSGISQDSILGFNLFLSSVLSGWQNYLPELVDYNSYNFLFVDDNRVSRKIKNEKDRHKWFAILVWKIAPEIPSRGHDPSFKND